MTIGCGRTPWRTVPRRCLAHAVALLLATLTLAACGSGGSSGGDAPEPEPTATPFTPTSTPSPATTPTASPGGPAVVAPMRLPGRYASSVNGLGWIAVSSTSPRVPLPLGGRLVLPPDAGNDALPPPVLPCAPEKLPERGCDGSNVPLAVADTEWVYGVRQSFDRNGWTLEPMAYGPDGEAVPLVDPRRARGGAMASGVHLGPGPLLTGLFQLDAGSDGDPRFAVVWRAPGDEPERLDATGFPEGVAPAASDAAGWIAGVGYAGPSSMPVVWVPVDGDWVIEGLPLLPGSTSGVASDVDGGRIVGWSADEGSARAVVWTTTRSGFDVAELPLPAGAVACTSASAISGPRIVGRCEDAQRAGLAVVWRSSDDAAWYVELLLAEHEVDFEPFVVDIRGDLAVGGSFRSVLEAVAVAWRLP